MEDELNSNGDVNDESEREHFFKIVHAFKSYKEFAQSAVKRRLVYLKTLPPRQHSALKAYKSNLEQVLGCIDINHKVLQLITEDVEKLFDNVEHPFNSQDKSSLDTKILTVFLNGNNMEFKNAARICLYPRAPDRAVGHIFMVPSPPVNVSDVEKVQVTLKQIYRDWSRDGVIERIQAYQPILDEIEAQFPSSSDRKREDINILVPGAGLGRLAFEVAKLGFSCQGNEFSLFMLFASNFILNRCGDTDLYTIYPWTQSCDNNMTSQEMIRPVSFPDADPSVLHRINAGKTRFTMVAGDFLEVYQTPDEWDCIATCFFIDCASNVYTFIEQIYRILKPGGVWVNLGPLQYHFSSSQEESSIEPSFEDVKLIIKSVGFHMQKEETRHPTLYCQNRNSMLKQHYDSVFFTCIKLNK